MQPIIIVIIVTHLPSPPRRNAEGRGASTVYRDKATGRVMAQDEYLAAKVGWGVGWGLGW